MEIVLGGKARQLDEPVFKRLRIILAAYNVLASSADDDAAKLQAIDVMLEAATLGTVKRSQLLLGELGEFVKAMPELCEAKPSNAESMNGKADRWGMIYGHLSMCFGWTYDYINDHMTMSRLREMEEYFLQNPPIHQFAAAYFEYKPPNQKSDYQFLANLAAQVKSQSNKL